MKWAIILAIGLLLFLNHNGRSFEIIGTEEKRQSRLQEDKKSPLELL
jgi:hypothetical protein